MKLTVLTLLGSAGVATASWAQNLNYRSPSEHHPGLGIAIHKVVKRNDPQAAIDPSTLNFTHGVASGDPYPKSVILWTRVAPTSDNDKSNVTVSGFVPLYNHETEIYIKASTAPICVDYKVARDKELRQVVDKGKAYTTSDIDYTVKVEAKNLRPYSTYYYQFNVCNSKVASPVGRTKTTPKPKDKIDEVKLAIFSCSNYPFGFFNAYGNVVKKDTVDYVVHLGDYLYEYENGYYGNGSSVGRVPYPEKEIFSLYDYRKRHATYRTDLDLLDNHQLFPWIPVWDDHEVADNTYRDGSSELNNTEASFIKDGGVSVDQRKMNAVRAYFEWMPIRQVAMDDNLRIWRSFQIGDLLDLIMLDTRVYDRSITDLYWNTDYVNKISNDAGRSLMGGRQENWFYNQLSESSERGATWRVIGSQIVFTHLNLSFASGASNPLNYDAWDGYQANRNRTLNHLYSNDIRNNIFLAGDSHASWVSDLNWPDAKPYDSDTGAGSIGVEFAGSAVSSPSPAGATSPLTRTEIASLAAEAANPWLHWSDFYYRGYFELSLTHDKADARFFGLPTVTRRNAWEIPLANFTVVSAARGGAGGLSRPLGGGKVLAGALRGGQTERSNATLDLGTGGWFVSHEDRSVLPYN